MPKVTLMPSGVKAFVFTNHQRKPGKRQGCNGWSLASARRNDLFLRSVEYARLDGVAFSFTLTLRTCPKDHSAWERMRRAYIERLRRMGLIRLHWLTEWQPRCREAGGPAPHLHAVAFFDEAALRADYQRSRRPTHQALVGHWLDISRACGSQAVGQHVVTVTSIKGWFQYLAKHGARGVFHYQRQSDVRPDGWDKTGRMWGKSGFWPVSADELRLSSPAFYALRRAMKRLMVQDARRDLHRSVRPSHRLGARKRLNHLRRLHQGRQFRREDLTPDQVKSTLQRIGRVSSVSEWCDPGLVLRWLHGVCVPVETYDPDTGEVFQEWQLSA